MTLLLLLCVYLDIRQMKMSGRVITTQTCSFFLFLMSVCRTTVILYSLTQQEIITSVIYIC